MEENKEMNQENLENTFSNRIDFTELHQTIGNIKKEIGKVIVGQEQMLEELLVALLANGHVLIEGVPGVAKTITAKLLAKTVDTQFSRIQFTPDLMPADILGTSVFNLKNSEFEFKKGPIFSNFVLIDEINRSPAKTQAALFEVMEERQITIDGNQYKMEEPFLVLATQNPIEQEGTYRLPEAQLDRFLFKIQVKYPSLEEEIQIIAKEHELKTGNKVEQVKAILTTGQLKKYQTLIKDVSVEEKVLEYIAKIVHQTREHAFLYLGASPRASIALLTASKGFAAIRGRDFVTPEDIKDAANAVLRHRIIVSPEREMEGLKVEEVIQMIIDAVEIPR